ncbi:MAG: DUF5818 domain-containing protein [Sphingobium sp.]
MPRGARHVETGILRPGRWGYSLEMDGGGVWQLDIGGSARRYLGQRVTIEGIRSGFDLIDVHHIRLAGDPPREKREGLWQRLFGA